MSKRWRNYEATVRCGRDGCENEITVTMSPYFAGSEFEPPEGGEVEDYGGCEHAESYTEGEWARVIEKVNDKARDQAEAAYDAWVDARIDRMREEGR